MKIQNEKMKSMVKFLTYLNNLFGVCIYFQRPSEEYRWDHFTFDERLKVESIITITMTPNRSRNDKGDRETPTEDRLLPTKISLRPASSETMRNFEKDFTLPTKNSILVSLGAAHEMGRSSCAGGGAVLCLVNLGCNYDSDILLYDWPLDRYGHFVNSSVHGTGSVFFNFSSNFRRGLISVENFGTEE